MGICGVSEWLALDVSRDGKHFYTKEDCPFSLWSRASVALRGLLVGARKRDAANASLLEPERSGMSLGRIG